MAPIPTRISPEQVNRINENPYRAALATEGEYSARDPLIG